jgi:hypothetical protein
MTNVVSETAALTASRYGRWNLDLLQVFAEVAGRKERMFLFACGLLTGRRKPVRYVTRLG